MPSIEKEIIFDAQTYALLRQALALVHDRYDEANYYMHELRPEQLREYIALLDNAEHRAEARVIRLTYGQLNDFFGIAHAWADTDAFHPHHDDEDGSDPPEFALAERIEALLERYFGEQPSAFPPA